MKRALISGAGIAGLTASLWLKKFGFEVVIVERAASPRGGGFLVSLSDYAYRAADELGVLEAMQKRDMGIARSSYHDVRGQSLLALDYETLFTGVDVLQIMRADVVDVLYQAAKSSVEIRFDTTILHLEDRQQGVNVEFSDKSQERFDVLIVAEGQNSSTRQLVLKDEVELDFLGLHCAAMKLPNVLGISEKFETHMDLGRYMAAFNTPDGDLGCVFVWSESEIEVPRSSERLEVIKQAFSNSSKTIASLLSEAPEEGIYMDSLKQVISNTWHKNRTVFIGDAAHCLTLFSGRGAAAAIAGATRLVKQIDLRGIDQGIMDYEAKMRALMDPIQKQTRSAVNWYVPQTKAQQICRDSAMKYLPNWLFQKYFQYKYSNV